MIAKALFAVYAIFLLALSACKSTGIGLSELNLLQGALGGDKLMHFQLAGLLAFLGFTAFASVNTRSRVTRLFTVLLLLAGVLLMDEFHQYYVGARHFDWLDTVYGVFGLLVGLVIRLLMDYSFLCFKRPKVN